MIIGALGDAHGGMHLTEAMAREAEGVDLLLLAGDIADGNDLDSFARAYDLIRARYQGPIVAIFGNDEYDQDRPAYRKRFDALFLDDEAADLTVCGTKVRIVGSTGPLDRPTWWQRTHVPNIWHRYRERVSVLRSLLERGDAEVLIYLSHYAPTFLTLEGERARAFPEMGSEAMEKVLLEKAPDMAIHAHAHNGSPRAVLRRTQMSLDEARPREVPVWNVSLPLNKRITRLELKKGDGWNAQVPG